MSERLERWIGPEAVRVYVGWLAVLVGLKGCSYALGGLLLLGERLAGIEEEASIAGIPGTHPLALPTLVLGGVALLLCARALWRARPWARWAAFTLLVLSFAQPLPRVLRQFEIHGLLNPGSVAVLVAMLVPLSMIAYLLLPATGRFFARAEGSQPRAKLFFG